MHDAGMSVMNIMDNITVIVCTMNFLYCTIYSSVDPVHCSFFCLTKLMFGFKRSF